MHIFLTANDQMMKGDSFALRSRRRMRKMLIRDGMSFVGVCFSVAGLSVLGYQYLLWMNYGQWSPLAFRLVLELIGAREPLFAWQSVEKISACVCDLPLSGVLFATGVVAVTFGVAVTAGGCAPEAAKSDRVASVATAFDQIRSS